MIFYTLVLPLYTYPFLCSKLKFEKLKFETNIFYYVII